MSQTSTAILGHRAKAIFQEASFSSDFCFTNSGSVPGSAAIKRQQISFSALQGLRYSDNVVAIARKTVQ
jgi:hypothetical protein